MARFETMTASVPRAATRVVAASNASALMKAFADYTCDGSADDVQINAAITACPSFGGKVLLSEGDFYIRSSILIDKPGITLEGMNRGSRDTNTTTAGTNIRLESGYSVTDAVLVSPSGTITITGPTVLNLSVMGGFTYGIHFKDTSSGDGADLSIDHVTVLDVTQACIYLEQSSGNVAQWIYISNCNFTGGATAGLYVNGSTYVHISNTGIYSCSGDAIKLTGSCNTILIDNLSLYNNSKHGINIDAAQYVDINNIIVLAPSNLTDNTYDGIYIANASNYVLIDNLIVVGADSTHQYRWYVNNAGSAFDIKIGKYTGTLIYGKTSGTVVGSEDSGETFEIPLNAGWTTDHSGGSGSFFPTQLQVNTGAAGAQQRGVFYASCRGLENGAAAGSIDWSKPIDIWAEVMREVSDANVTARLQLKIQQNASQLGAKGLGLEVNNFSFVGESFGSLRGTVSLTATLAGDTKPSKLRWSFVPATRFDFFIENILVGSITDASYLPTGISTGGIWNVSIQSGATGSSNALFSIMPKLRVRYGRT